MPEFTRSATFVEEVFPAEIEEIAERRRFHGMDEPEPDGTPDASKGLVGLSFSGGGIRSASFCLGVAQRLARAGLLRHVDYLSTVSGGGYTGSCLSSLLSAPDRTPDDPFPLRHDEGEPEPPALQHLRNSSKFLTPGGFLEKVRLPVMIARGTVLSVLVFLPLVMAAVIVTELIYELGPNPRALFISAPIEAWALLLLIVTVPFLGRLVGRRLDWDFRNRYQLTLAGLAVLFVATLALIPVSHLVRLAVEQPWDATKYALEHGRLLDELGIPAYWLWLGPLILLGFVVLVARASTLVGHWADRLVIYVVGFMGPAIIVLVYLFLCISQVDSPYIAPGFRADLDWMADRPGMQHEPSPGLVDAFENREMGLGPLISVSRRTVVRTARGMTHVDTVWTIASTGPIQPEDPDPNRISITSVGRHRLMIEGARVQPFNPPEDIYFFVVFILLVAFNMFVLDVNTASLHGYYRDRLSKAFLFRVNRSDGSIEPNDTLKLSGLGGGAPYHLVNAALNLQASRDHSLRGRMADFFLLSKRFVGSERTGYVTTGRVEEVDTRLDLAAAVAISGAAASPNMGSSTRRALTFIMTLLNLRLGYWIVNPRRLVGASYLGRLLRRAAGPTLLLREAIGNLHERGRFVNLSDGGHIENLGLYELLKRRCRFVVVVDAGADPAYQFGDLVRLMRFAEIDLGVTIDIDLDPLRPGPDGLNPAHAALGRIRYGRGGDGVLLYLKSSLTGDESEFIRHYRVENPAFPHQSTADQFFGEEDLEAYRALGWHVCASGLTECVGAVPGDARESVFEAWRSAGSDGI